MERQTMRNSGKRRVGWLAGAGSESKHSANGIKFQSSAAGQVTAIRFYK
jgi:hypothetical protein